MRTHRVRRVGMALLLALPLVTLTACGTTGMGTGLGTAQYQVPGMGLYQHCDRCYGGGHGGGYGGGHGGGGWNGGH